MGKDFNDKYSKLLELKDDFIEIIESQMSGDIAYVDAKELGEVTDMAKDMVEMIKLCSEAEYYYKVTKSMDESSKSTRMHYMNKYIPEYNGNFNFSDNESAHTMCKSGISRNSYMEMKHNGADKNEKIEEIKKYTGDLIEDINDMLDDASQEEKMAMKSKLVAFANKL